jgi:hypothetical protein
MNYLINAKRIRFALSINPSIVFHIGHLYGLLYTQEYARRNNLEFHLRYDDTYTVTTINEDRYPAKDIRWKKDITSHKPGCGIYEMIRPPQIVKTFVEKTSILFEEMDIKFDKKYVLSDLKSELPKDTLGFLEFIPFFFYEDACWQESVICRGMEWNAETGDLRNISNMQFMILDYLKANYKVVNFNLIKDNDVKISKSNENGEKFNLLNYDKYELKDIILSINQKVKEDICF